MQDNSPRPHIHVNLSIFLRKSVGFQDHSEWRLQCLVTSFALYSEIDDNNGAVVNIPECITVADYSFRQQVDLVIANGRDADGSGRFLAQTEISQKIMHCCSTCNRCSDWKN